MPAGKRVARQRRLEIRLHGAQRSDELLVGHPEPVAHIHALRPEPFADMCVQEPVADRRSRAARPWSRSISAIIMSSAEMPPEQVMRSPSISNSDGATSTSGKASRKAG